MAETSLLLHDHRIGKEEADRICRTIEASTGRRTLARIFKKRKHLFEPGAHLYVMAEDGDFKEWLKHIRHIDLRIVLLPFKGNGLCREAYAIPDTLEEAIELANGESAHLLEHQVLCNGEVIIGCASAGESGWISGKGAVSMLEAAVRNLFSLRLSPLQITTAKKKEISTASLLVETGAEALMQIKRPYFFKASDNQCRRIASVVYAPQSALEALKLRFFLAKRRFNPSETLPPGIGTIKSERIVLQSGSSAALELSVDGHKSEAREIRFETLPMNAKIVTGWKGCASGEEKESLRIQNLPQESELISFFSRKRLPLVPIASEEAFAELFMKLRSSARITASYLLLLLVSVLMASTGLFQNSSPTIIGAMILAPLMAPIVAFAMGAIRFDDTLMQRSTKTILLSVLIALGASALYAWWLPFTHITDQMAMRTHPTLLDLAVAIFAGIAAAYGYANSKVGESLAGVAIAVALVPPLCVSGIGIGWGSWPIFSNAFLLFLANIVGIIVASGAMFYLLGYASTRYASTAFFIKLLMVAVIAIPLYLSTRSLVAEEQIYRRFSTLHQIRIGQTPIEIRLSGIAHDPKGVYARFSIITPRELNTSEKEKIASTLQSKLGEGVGMVLTYRYRH